LASENEYSIEEQYRIFTVRPACDFDRKTVGRGIEYYTEVDGDTAVLDSVSATTNNAVIQIFVMEVHNVDVLIVWPGFIALFTRSPRPFSPFLITMKFRH
jgi:hypothetical protein